MPRLVAPGSIAPSRPSPLPPSDSSHNSGRPLELCSLRRLRHLYLLRRPCSFGPQNYCSYLFPCVHRLAHCLFHTPANCITDTHSAPFSVVSAPCNRQDLSVRPLVCPPAPTILASRASSPSHSRSRHHIIPSTPHIDRRSTSTMSADEKTRVSGDVPRPDASPVLPTVNPQAEKPQPATAALHPIFYIV